MSQASYKTCFLLFSLLWSSAAQAALRYLPHQTPEGVRFVVIDGDIGADDDLSEFARTVRSHNATVVSFNSPGGNVYKAMELVGNSGLRLNTVQFRGAECASACAFAFLGGVLRGAEPGIDRRA